MKTPLVDKNCLRCGKNFSTFRWRIKQGKGKYCSTYCARKDNTAIGRSTYRYVPPKNATPIHLRPRFGKDNYSWRGGITVDKSGYILKRKTDHPFVNGRGYVREHRLVIENHIGRYLMMQEVVHHIDFNKQNNNINNLMLFKNTSYHRRFESLGIEEGIIFDGREVMKK